LEERVADLEAQNEELRRRLGLPGTDMAALDAAIEEIVQNQDISALAAFLNRGGKIPTINCHPGVSRDPEERKASA